MKKLSSILLILSISISLSAVNSISGRVLDASTRQIIDFANVALSQAGDGKLVTGTSTDIDGKFTLSGMADGTYKVTISFMGYNDWSKTVTIKGQAVDLGKIYLEENTQDLQEVEVVGQGTTMRFELDKKVFSVDQNIAATGGSATDALEQVPSVDVDQDGNISLRNSDAVEIWINGRPSGLSAENRGDILKQMPAESIKEIEVITNPSAKYSPEGTAGIINLVMKKDRKAGYYGSLNLNLDYYLAKPWNIPPGGRAGFNFNFNKGIVDGYFNIGYHYHTSNGSSMTDRYNFSQSDTTHLLQNGESHHNGGGMFLRAGLDIHVTDRSSIGLSGFGMVTSPNDKTNGFFSNWSINPNSYELYDVTHYVGPQSEDNEETLLRKYDRTQQGRGYHPGYNAMIDWRFEINKQHKFSMSAQFDEFIWNSDHYYIQTDYNPADEAELFSTVQEQKTANDDKRVQLKADYEWKPTEQSRFEAGWQTDLAWRSTLAEAWNCSNNEGYERTEELTSIYNDFKNNEQNHALYITYGNRFWNKFSVQVGLRGEYFMRHIESSYYMDGTLKPYTQDTSYFQAFPSVYLSYDFGNGHELQANYTRRIDRPRGHQINPRQDISDSTNISYGNPSLLPQYSSSVELNYLKNWDRHVLSAGLFYRYADEVTQNIKFIDGSVMRNTFVNLGKRHEAGIEVVVKNRLFGEVLQLTTSANFYYNRLDAATYTPILNGITLPQVEIKEQNIFAGSVRLSANFMFTKTFTGQISGRYRSPRVVAQGRTSHNYSIDLGLRKTFLNNTLALALNVRDLLNSRARKTYSEGDGFWQFNQNRWSSRTISLNFTYNFGNTQPKRNEAFINNSNSAASQFEDNGSDE
ncbi:MAG: TonB-dependent receptor [Paludibacteraceae bacterium]|nr:TonB-dependent receptor [Paludibacteraceae bacterium]